jgi:hypothetical protein
MCVPPTQCIEVSKNFAANRYVPLLGPNLPELPDIHKKVLESSLAIG